GLTLHSSPTRRSSDLRRWRTETAAVRKFIDTHCWSDEKQSYVRLAGGDELDASLLLALLHGYAEPNDERMRKTVDAIGRELADRSEEHTSELQSLAYL